MQAGGDVLGRGLAAEHVALEHLRQLVPRHVGKVPAGKGRLHSGPPPPPDPRAPHPHPPPSPQRGTMRAGAAVVVLPYLSLGAQPEQQERAREQSQRGQARRHPKARSPAPSPRGSHPPQDPTPSMRTPSKHMDLPHPTRMGPSTPCTPHANRCTSSQHSARTGLPHSPPGAQTHPRSHAVPSPCTQAPPCALQQSSYRLRGPLPRAQKIPHSPRRAVPTTSPPTPTCRCRAPHPRRGCWPRAVRAAGSGPVGPPASTSGSAGAAAWPGPGRATSG